MATHNIKNISTGIRGFNAESGLVEIAPGQTAEGVEISDAELRSSARTGWFEIDGSTDEPDTGPVDDIDTTVPKLRELAKAEGVDLSGLTSKADIQGAIRAARTVAADKAAGGGASDLDAMDDATLLTTAAAITGKPEAELQGSDRDELLRLARGEA
jgi:hypothetical protein